LYLATNRLKEAESLLKRALAIYEATFGKDHPAIATSLNSLATLYQATNRFKEAESLIKRALAIHQASFGKDYPDVAGDLYNLTSLYKATNRLKEAEPLMEQAVVILVQSSRLTGHPHPHLQDVINNYAGLLRQMGRSEAQIAARLKRLAPEMFESTDNQPKEQ
jgi:tetratricopeptide (TPR) repeat protein